MKKIGIITIIDDNNYGNRLQNYAVQSTLKKMNCRSYTLKNKSNCNKQNNFLLVYSLLTLKNIQSNFNRLSRRKRYMNFKSFDKQIDFYKRTITSWNAKKMDNEFDYFLTGSDQIWNVAFRHNTYIDMLEFTTRNKKIAFSPSFGISEIPDKYKEEVSRALSNFKSISVREDAGKEIIESLTSRTDVKVLIDPTMLLTSQEWDKVAKKPTMLTTDKYILNYFLGSLSKEIQNEINKIAKKYGCQIINILDEKDPFYNCGPAEFLYLEKHAFLICTDSFHSSIFAIIYDRPFIIFDREDNHALKMNSRIKTLLSTFKLSNRVYNGTYITDENLNHDYTEAYRILENEKAKSISFLKNALDIEKSSNK